MSLSLLVGIDTESDDQWSLAARERPTFENLHALPALHERFRRHGGRRGRAGARRMRQVGDLESGIGGPRAEMGRQQRVGGLVRRKVRGYVENHRARAYCKAGPV